MVILRRGLNVAVETKRTWLALRAKGRGESERGNEEEEELWREGTEQKMS